MKFGIKVEVVGEISPERALEIMLRLPERCFFCGSSRISDPRIAAGLKIWKCENCGKEEFLRLDAVVGAVQMIEESADERNK